MKKYGKALNLIQWAIFVGLLVVVFARGAVAV